MLCLSPHRTSCHMLNVKDEPQALGRVGISLPPCLTGNQLYSCGWNEHGQLGLGDEQSHLVPTLVGGASPPWGASSISLVATGNNHTLIVAGVLTVPCLPQMLMQLQLVGLPGYPNEQNTKHLILS